MMAVLALVAACGGGNRYDRGDGGAVTRFSSGPISRACISSDRKARNPRLCGCIQTVADRTLSGSDQRRAASFFRDPQKAQEIKMSDRAGHDAFWDRYKAFVGRAENGCRGY